MVSLLDWGDFVHGVLNAARTESAARRVAWGSAKRKSVVALDADGSAAPLGDKRLALVRECLDLFENFPRSETQKRFHAEFTRSVMPHIYGTADFEKNRDRIMRENGMTRIMSETLVCTPRRFGKTTAVGMFCAVLLATCPDMWISVFSPGQRASSALLEQTAKVSPHSGVISRTVMPTLFSAVLQDAPERWDVQGVGRQRA